MGVEIRLPNITGTTEKEQLLQLKSYLYQLSEQLQWAFDNINTTGGSGGQGGSTVVLNPVRGGNTSSGGSSENTGPAFNELKALIIKTADTVDAYYEEITSKLVSEYVAQSDFGTYTERTEKLERETAAFTEETYTKFATIEGEIEDYRVTQGYIKTGIIVDNLTAEEAEKYGKKEDDALIGVEVGETSDGGFKKYARFAPNRLSFYNQGGSELAYVSSEKLYIRNAEIEESFQEGGFVDYIDADGGIVTKWVGGS